MDRRKKTLGVAGREGRRIVRRRHIPTGLEGRVKEAAEVRARVVDAAALRDKLALWWTSVINARRSVGASAVLDELSLSALAPFAASNQTSDPSIESSLVGLALPAELEKVLPEASREGQHDLWGSAHSIAAHEILAEALGHALATLTPGPGLIETALDLASQRQLPFDGVRRGLVAGIGTSQRAAWLTSLATLPPTIEGYFDEWAFDLNLVAMNEDAASWEKNIDDPFVAWTLRQDGMAPIGHRLHFRLDSLLDLEPRAWCEAIERMPTPGVMRYVVESAGLLDEPDTLGRTIDEAPTSLGTDASWTRATVAVLLALAIVEWVGQREMALGIRWRSATSTEAHDKARSEHNEYRTKTAASDLRTWFARLARRPDGSWILRALLTHLISRAHLDHWNQMNRDWSAAGAGVDAIAVTLAAQGYEHVKTYADEACAEAQSAASASASIERAFDRLLGVSCIYGNCLGPTSAPTGPATIVPDREAARSLWNAFVALLKISDVDLNRMLTSDRDRGASWVVNIVGFVLAHVEEPPARWEEAYSVLEPQRRRSLFGGTPDDRALTTFSALLIRAGFASIDWTKREAQTTAIVADPGDFFWKLHTQALRLYLAHRDRHAGPDMMLAWSFSLVPTLFASDLASALKRMVPPIASDARVVVAAAWTLWKASIPLSDVRAYFDANDAHLESALEEVTKPEPAAWGGARAPEQFVELSKALAEADGSRVPQADSSVTTSAVSGTNTATS